MRGWIVFGMAVPALALVAGQAQAHASEQGFVLLLPTDVYIASGVASVVVTIVLLALVPGHWGLRVFQPVALLSSRSGRAHLWVSCLAALVLGALVLIGWFGPRDPLENPLPLTIWTVWWVALVTVQGLVGNIWRWINPLTGPGVVLRRVARRGALLCYPRTLGHLPAILGFLAFAGFLMADPAPSDPARLAVVVTAYWLTMLAGLAVFGPRWLLRGEAVTVLMRSYGRMAVFGRLGRGLAMGLPGWQVLRKGGAGRLGLAVFALVLLGCGSFDGLNETFWWFVLLGLNPLEFPGRSAVIPENLSGLILANIGLVLVFVFSTWVGLRLARSRADLREGVRLFAPAVLPIALGYHIAHYLTVFLVDGQYVLAALSDPLHRGDDLLGLGHHSVTTGFLFRPGPVKVIWLTQAGAVVIGHIIAIMLAHVLALRMMGDRRSAVLSQVPLALFMVGYTFFGLWLLASPRGG